MLATYSAYNEGSNQIRHKGEWGKSCAHTPGSEVMMSLSVVYLVCGRFNRSSWLPRDSRSDVRQQLPRIELDPSNAGSNGNGPKDSDELYSYSRVVESW